MVATIAGTCGVSPKVNACRAFCSTIEYLPSRGALGEGLRRDAEHVSILKETWWRAPSL
jgi:hypothetical protein